MVVEDRVDFGDWDVPKSFTRSKTRLESVGLVHMNGRVYDPEIGRFLSADPHVQLPHASQSYNRYSYVINNPLKYTDPSGYFLRGLFRTLRKFVREYGRMIVAIGIAWMTGGAAAGLVGSSFAIGAAAGFAGGLVATGSLKGALKGAIVGGISAGVAYGVGQIKELGGLVGESLAVAKDFIHGVSQGIISEVSGGDFRSGFFGATLGHFAGRKAEFHFPQEPGNVGNMVGRTTVALVAGGTAATLGGGKFANGAVSAAFAHLFNTEATKAWQQKSGLMKIKDGAVNFYDKGEIGNRMRQMSPDDWRTALGMEGASTAEVLSVVPGVRRELVRMSISDYSQFWDGVSTTTEAMVQAFVVGGNPALAKHLGVSNYLLKTVDWVIGAGDSNPYDASPNTGMIPERILK